MSDMHEKIRLANEQRRRIESLSDDALTSMVSIEPEKHPPEEVELAMDEIRKRGLQEGIQSKAQRNFAKGDRISQAEAWHTEGPSATTVAQPKDITSAPSRDYTALRGIASLCTGLSWIIVVLAGLSVIGGLLTLSSSFIVGFGIIMFSVVIGGLSFIFLRVIAESISVILDIEANTRRSAVNTRRSAVILEQRLK